MTRRRALKSFEKKSYAISARVVCHAMNLPVACIYTKRRIYGRKQIARKLTIYLTIIMFNLPRRRLSRAIGFTDPWIGQVCREIEDMRDRAPFDDYLTSLEHKVVSE